MEASWLPTSVAMGALGLIWFGMRKDRTNAKKDLREFKTEAFTEFLSKQDHLQLCGKAQAELRLEIQKDLYAVKDELKNELTDIKLELRKFNQR